MNGQSKVHLFSIVVIFIADVLLNGVSLSAFAWLMSGLWIFPRNRSIDRIDEMVDTAGGVSNILYMLLAITGGMWMQMEISPKTIHSIGAWLTAFNLW